MLLMQLQLTKQLGAKAKIVVADYFLKPHIDGKQGKERVNGKINSYLMICLRG